MNEHFVTVFLVVLDEIDEKAFQSPPCRLASWNRDFWSWNRLTLMSICVLQDV